jgi:hypothetical protein
VSPSDISSWIHARGIVRAANELCRCCTPDDAWRRLWHCGGHRSSAGAYAATCHRRSWATSELSRKTLCRHPALDSAVDFERVPFQPVVTQVAIRSTSQTAVPLISRSASFGSVPMRPLKSAILPTFLRRRIRPARSGRDGPGR